MHPYKGEEQMNEPVILIHGYSSEGKTSDSGQYDRATVSELYGRLVTDLQNLGVPVVPVNVSRYISLDDGVSIDDLSFSMDRVLKAQYPDLLKSGFNAIIHSTGALVARNWIRRHTEPDKKCPLK